MTRTCFWTTLLLLGAFSATSVQAAAHRHRRHHHHHRGQVQEEPLDLTPVAVQPYVLPLAADPPRAAFLRRMNLENGLEVRSTRWITPDQVRTRDLFVLDVTQSLEGGFDSVNMYDKGVLSWGIMQWTAHAGSLAHALLYVKRELLAQKRKALWDKLFTAQGMDVNRDGLVVYGKPIVNADEARLAFRGSRKLGNYDLGLASHWAAVMARAGRQPRIQALQADYACHVVEGVLHRRLEGVPYHAPDRDGVTVADLADNDPYAEALVFALWTNNPRHAWQYVSDAARAARSVSGFDDPSLWAPGSFSDALLRRCRTSRFGNWRQRADMIEARSEAVQAASTARTPFERAFQTVLAARKARRQYELASRHLLRARAKRAKTAPAR